MYSEREIVKVKGAKKCNNRLQFYLFCKSSFVRRSSKVCTVTDKTLHDLFMKIVKKTKKKKTKTDHHHTHYKNAGNFLVLSLEWVLTQDAFLLFNNAK